MTYAFHPGAELHARRKALKSSPNARRSLRAARQPTAANLRPNANSYSGASSLAAANVPRQHCYLVTSRYDDRGCSIGQRETPVQSEGISLMTSIEDAISMCAEIFDCTAYLLTR
jgi:hypothetical protein